MSKNKFCIAIIMLFCVAAFAQISDYSYKRNIENFTTTWHSIALPDAVFSKVKPNLSDIRIFGITKEQDTIEAPYLLKIQSEKTAYSNVPFQIINRTKTTEGYYYTFKLNEEATINHIKLNFDTTNFDWNVNLEASQNQNKWFTILKDYRILAIRNADTKFNYTKLTFSAAKYRYFRVLIKSNIKPKLTTATIEKRTVTKGIYKNYDVVKTKVSDDKKTKTSVIDFQLKSKVPVEDIKLDITTKTDYYRPFKIEYLADSINTEKGWKYNYRTIKNGTLHSLDKSSISVSKTIAQNFRITIYNNDNQPLTVNSVLVKGFEHQLIVRFTKNAKYSLVYGNTSARKPNYDIKKFTKKIPEVLQGLQINNEQIIAKKNIKNEFRLFENKYWLWGIMILIILLLGGFTLKMMNKKELN